MVLYSLHVLLTKLMKDVYRLGKYNTDDNRPRQLLVKMIRASDVTAVLTRKSSLDRSIYIRRDLPREVRVGQAVLRKERRRLIDSGVHYSDISVRGDRILVKTILYGSLDVNDRSRFTKDSDSPIVQSNVQPNDAQPLEIDETVETTLRDSTEPTASPYSTDNTTFSHSSGTSMAAPIASSSPSVATPTESSRS